MLERIELECGCVKEREPKIQGGVTLMKDVVKGKDKDDKDIIEQEIDYTVRQLSFCEEHNPVPLAERQAQAVRDEEERVRAIERKKEKELDDKVMARIKEDTLAKLESEGKLSVEEIKIKNKKQGVV